VAQDADAKLSRVVQRGAHSALPASVLRQYPHELSGGMVMAVMIAMAWLCDPKLLIRRMNQPPLWIQPFREILGSDG